MVYIQRGYVLISSDPDSSPTASWVAKVETCGGRDYVHIDRSNPKCAHALNANWDMLNTIVWLRNQATNALMAGLA
eukprot:1152166-Pyramimonas_sp.AAC.1